MEKKAWIIAAAAVLTLIAIVGVSMAQAQKQRSGRIGNSGMGGMGMMNGMGANGMMAHHEEMEEVMEEGTYDGLVQLREKYGISFMPWVQSEADFAQAREIHEKMEKYMEENSNAAGFGTGKMAGCPMMG